MIVKVGACHRTVEMDGKHQTFQFKRRGRANIYPFSGNQPVGSGKYELRFKRALRMGHGRNEWSPLSSWEGEITLQAGHEAVQEGVVYELEALDIATRASHRFPERLPVALSKVSGSERTFGIRQPEA